MSNWSERLKLRMRELGVTNAGLAREIGIAAPSVHAWVNGSRPGISGENLLRVARLLRVSPYWLMFGEVEAEAPVSSTSQAARPETEKLRASIAMVEGALEQLGIDYPPATKAQIVVAVYAAIEAAGEAAAAKDVVATMLKTVSQAVKT